jgi:hypothetical protein
MWRPSTAVAADVALAYARKTRLWTAGRQAHSRGHTLSRASFEETIVALIARLPVAGVLMPEGLPALAKRLGVLPLTWDMGGCLALRPTGEVVSWAWDQEEQVSLERSARVRHVAMFQGAAKFVDLRPFLPVRPADAPICTSCSGTGIASGLPQELGEQVVCLCGGSGWLPLESRMTRR